MTSSTRSAVASLLAALALLMAACGSDDGATVRDLGADEGTDSASDGSDASSSGGSASASAPASGSDSADGGGDGSESSAGDGGYEYASNVDAHRLVVADICPIGELLDAADFAAVEALYRDGGSSVNSDGSVRTIAGFAQQDDANHGLDVYYGTPAPLDEFVTAALTGTGMFEGRSDAVRAQGAEKGIQNQVMVAWTIHELNSAVAKAEDGDFDVADGAVHNWDEGWAFYHGSEPGCAPYATGNSRAANFGTVGADGETAVANEAILAAMISGRDALLVEDADGARAAVAEVIRNLVITYSQAAIRYAGLIEDDLAEGNVESAEEHQAEGLAFWRVIESVVARSGADFDAVNAILDLANEPGADGFAEGFGDGFGDTVRAALEPAWDELGITDEDIGELE